MDKTSQELSPSHNATSFLEQPCVLHDPYDYNDGTPWTPMSRLRLSPSSGDPGECPDTYLARFDLVRRANSATTPTGVARIFPT